MSLGIWGVGAGTAALFVSRPRVLRVFHNSFMFSQLLSVTPIVKNGLLIKLPIVRVRLRFSMRLHLNLCYSSEVITRTRPQHATSLSRCCPYPFSKYKSWILDAQSFAYVLFKSLVRSAFKIFSSCCTAPNDPPIGTSATRSVNNC